MTMSLDTFAQQELQRIQRERDQAIKDKGGRPYYKVLVGETNLILRPMMPAEDVRDGKMRRQFVVTKPGDATEYAWTVNTRSPLYKKLLELLPEAPVTVKVVRTGEGKSDTRYDIRKVE